MTSSGPASEWIVCDSSGASADVKTRHFSVPRRAAWKATTALRRQTKLQDPAAYAAGRRGTLSTRPDVGAHFGHPFTNRAVRLPSVVRVPPSSPRTRPARYRPGSYTEQETDGQTDRPTYAYCLLLQPLLSVCTRSKLLDGPSTRGAVIDAATARNTHRFVQNEKRSIIRSLGGGGRNNSSAANLASLSSSYFRRATRHRRRRRRPAAGHRPTAVLVISVGGDWSVG